MTQGPVSLIALVGKKGAGKDTVASVLLEDGYANVKFAGGLKAMLSALLAYQGVDPDTIERMVEGDLKEVETPYLCGRTPRHAMQTLGTEWGRILIDDALWVNAAMTKARAASRAVFTDCRFPNELEAVRTSGGTSIRINSIGSDSGSDAHASEAFIDELDVDADFSNDKSLGVDVARRMFAAFLAVLTGETTS